LSGLVDQASAAVARAELGYERDPGPVAAYTLR